jgi:hypothetical protein
MWPTDNASLNILLSYIRSSSTLMIEAIFFSENIVTVKHLCRDFYGFIPIIKRKCRSQWPPSLRNEQSSAAQTLGSWVRTPLEALIFVFVYSVFVLSCVGSDLAASWSSVQGVLQTVWRSRNWKIRHGPSKGSVLFGVLSVFLSKYTHWRADVRHACASAVRWTLLIFGIQESRPALWSTQPPIQSVPGVLSRG